MIIYVHSKFLPLNTFLVSAKASWTVLRVRGYLLHKLAEIGHHRHPFRLKFKGEYLKDTLTLEESGIYDTVALELVPLATVQDLQSDLFWRYKKHGPRDEPHLVALNQEIEIFRKRQKYLQIMKVLLMMLYPIAVLDFFLPSDSQNPYWVWGLAQVIYAMVGLYFAPGFTYLSGWVGKEKNVIKDSKAFDYFSIFCGFSLFTFLMNILCIGLVSQLVLCGEDVLEDCTSSTVPLSYAYMMLSLSSIVILAVTCLSGYLYFNAQLDYGEIIEQSLTKFKSEDQIRDALKSSDQAQKRAAAFEISTRVQGGEDEKYKILEKELLQPLNNLCLSTDRYTQEHATEAIAELLTLPEIQEHYMALCNVTTISSVLVNTTSPKARLETLNALSYLADSKHKFKMAAVLDDIISCIDSPDRLNDEEYELILNIFSNLLSTDITLTTELTNSIASILSDAKGEHIQRECLNCFLIIATSNPAYLCTPSCLDEILTVSTRTIDESSISAMFDVIVMICSTIDGAEFLLDPQNLNYFRNFVQNHQSRPEYQLVTAQIINKIVNFDNLLGSCLDAKIDEMIGSFLDENPQLDETKALLFESGNRLALEKRRRIRNTRTDDGNGTRTHSRLSRITNDISSTIGQSETLPSLEGSIPSLPMA